MTHPSPSTRTGGAPWLILAPVLAIALAVLTVAWPRLTNWFEASTFAPRPTPYSELYFADPGPPLTIAPGTSLAVAFTIGNHEQGSVDYRYVVSVSCDTPPIADSVTDVVTVEQGARAEVALSLVPKKCPVGGHLRVGLIYRRPGTSEQMKLHITNSFR